MEMDLATKSLMLYRYVYFYDMFALFHMCKLESKWRPHSNYKQ